MLREISQPITRRGIAAAASVACAASLLFAAAAGAETITVDVGDDVTSAVDGDCTLREALTAANMNTASGAAPGECPAGEDGPAVRDVVDFSLGMGNHVIALAGTALPSLNDQVEVDGSNGTALARIEINGAGVVGAGVAGIFLTSGSDGSEIHDIAVNNFSGDGVNLFTGGHVLRRVISGTDLAGTASTLGNGGFGIDVMGDGNELDQVVSSANDGYGVNVSFEADGTTITGSRIGTTRLGIADLGNGDSGIHIGASNIEGADDTTIGGTTGLTPGGACTGDCNVISGNDLDGIMALGSEEFAASGLVIRGNHIGSDLAGTAAVPNRSGINLAGNVPGALVRENLLSGNTAHGVSVGPWTSPTVTIAPSGTLIEGNRIGVVTTGDAALGNGDNGVQVVSDVASGFDPITGTVIGGTDGLTPGGACTGDCNVISGSTDFGISLFGAVDGTQVLGNHVGVDPAGDSDVGNGQSGISIAATGGTIVGAPAAGNVISGNQIHGIQITDADPGNQVRANLIGTGADGSLALGNGQSGVSIRTGTVEAQVGGLGAGEGNAVANNGSAGIEIGGGLNAATGNALLGNSVLGNTGLGIDLGDESGGGDGPTPNDGPGDADDGGNDLQNFPELTAAVAGSSTFVAGRLESSASDDFRIEIFSSSSGDEGETLLGSFEVTTDGAGVATFAETVDGTAAPGDPVTATATKLDEQGDPLSTSEFAAATTEGCDNVPTAGADTVVGTAADEVLCGLGGADSIAPGGGDDVIIGGDGDDELDLSNASAGAEVDLGSAEASVGADDLAVHEIEDVTGTDLADDITADSADNVLEGGDGNDTLLGLDGADVARGGDGKDTAKGGDGKDTIKGGDGKDTATGGDGKDTLKGNDGGDTLKGQGSRDKIKAGDGNDTLKGGGGTKDDLDGGKGRDSLNGGGDKKDICDGGPDRDKRSAPGCETKKSIP